MVKKGEYPEIRWFQICESPMVQDDTGMFYDEGNQELALKSGDGKHSTIVNCICIIIFIIIYIDR